MGRLVLGIDNMLVSMQVRYRCGGVQAAPVDRPAPGYRLALRRNMWYLCNMTMAFMHRATRCVLSGLRGGRVWSFEPADAFHICSIDAAQISPQCYHTSPTDWIMSWLVR